MKSLFRGLSSSEWLPSLENWTLTPGVSGGDKREATTMRKTMSGWNYWEKGVDAEAKSHLKQKVW